MVQSIDRSWPNVLLYQHAPRLFYCLCAGTVGAGVGCSDVGVCVSFAFSADGMTKSTIKKTIAAITAIPVHTPKPPIVGRPLAGVESFGGGAG
jgi:hypothetical protein